MRGRAAAGEMCAVAAQPHSTRATSDVLCGAVVANSTAGGAAGGAGLVATGSRTTASAVAAPTKKIITAAIIARTWIVAADKKVAARLRKGRGARAGGQTHQSLLQFETIDLQMGPAKAKTPSWTAGLK